MSVMPSGESGIGESKAEDEAVSHSMAASETAGTRDRIQIILAACGIVGPILYAAAIIVFGLSRTGYEPLTQVISELGEVGAPNAIVWNTIAFVVNLLTIAFAIGLYRDMRGGWRAKVGPALLIVSGFSLGAFFPCSPGCELGTSTSHLVANSPGIGVLLAPLAFWPTLGKDSRWRGYGPYSLVTGVVAILIFLANFSGLTRPWDGLGQRLFLAVLFLWGAIMAVHLLRLSRRPIGEGAPTG